MESWRNGERRSKKLEAAKLGTIELTDNEGSYFTAQIKRINTEQDLIKDGVEPQQLKDSVAAELRTIKFDSLANYTNAIYVKAKQMLGNVNNEPNQDTKTKLAYKYYYFMEKGLEKVLEKYEAAKLELEKLEKDASKKLEAAKLGTIKLTKNENTYLANQIDRIKIEQELIKDEVDPQQLKDSVEAELRTIKFDSLAGALDAKRNQMVGKSVSKLDAYKYYYFREKGLEKFMKEAAKIAAMKQKKIRKKASKPTKK